MPKRRFPRFKSIVLNIRGSNGSGKSTAVRKFLRNREGECYTQKSLYNGIPGKPEKLWGYKVYNSPMGGVPLYVIGPYENPGGGCDLIPNFDFICKTIQLLAKRGHVVFEGAIISTVYGRWAELQKEMKDYAHFIFGILDTPQWKCVKRVNKRRALRGKEPIDPKRSMDGKYRAVQTSARKLKSEGMDVRILPHKKPFKTSIKWLGEEYGRDT